MRLAAVDRVFRIVVNVMLVVMLLVVITPEVITVTLSFSSSLALPPAGFTTGWYEEFFQEPKFTRSLFFSLGLAVVTAVIATVLGTGLALVLVRRRFYGRALISFVVSSAYSLPRVATGIALFLFFVALGLVNVPARLLLAHTVIALPYVLSVVSASLVGLDRRLEEAAMNLGASTWETFRRVTLPIIRPGIAAGAIFAFVASFEEVTASVFLVDGRTTTFPVVLFAFMYRNGIDPTIAAASSLMLTLVVVVVLLLARTVGLSRALGIWRL
jgi:putative spermidine/putrescine transport system permease protein